MADKNSTNNNYISPFEQIKETNEYRQEFWSASQLAKMLEYNDYRNFTVAVYKAMQACKNSKQKISDHFGEATKMIVN